MKEPWSSKRSGERRKDHHGHKAACKEVWGAQRGVGGVRKKGYVRYVPFGRRTRAGSLELEARRLGSVEAAEEERKKKRERALEERAREALGAAASRQQETLSFAAAAAIRQAVGIGLTCPPSRECRRPG